jgi:Gpi18-like mannosyltransferase
MMNLREFASRHDRIALLQKTSILIVVATAVVARFLSRDYRSGDYRGFLSKWTDYIVAHGGFHAFQHEFADYNVPYLYLLVLVTYLPISHLYGIKLLSVAFDALLAFFAYRIVALRYPQSYWPKLAAAIVFGLPTVVMNSSRWGQADSVYTAFLLGGVYFALRRKSAATGLFFGLAFAVKLQTAFFFPVLLFLVLRRWLSWRVVWLIPGVYLVLDIPALAFGATPHTLWHIYPEQFNEYHDLTMNAANIYQFLGSIHTPERVRIVAIGYTGILVLGLIAWGLRRRIAITPTAVLLIFTWCAILVPYFLPSMQERYYYPADVLAVLIAFQLPLRLWVLPILVQLGSALTYLGFMFPQFAVRRPGARHASNPPEWALLTGAGAMTVALAVITWVTLREVRESRDNDAAEREHPLRTIQEPTNAS